jgi:hypothetical protein
MCCYPIDLHNSHVETQIWTQKARMRLAEEALMQMEAKSMPIGPRTLSMTLQQYRQRNATD